MNLEKEINKRRDFRDALTFTIDPSDAKDFDDALSFEVCDDGSYQVGVHIADVTHYVHLGSKENDDAYERGTSVYLVDCVLPMLPESLCNDLCSLRPNEDKLCMSVIFNLSHDARVLKYKICRTVIRSDYRLTYTQAQQIIKEGVQDAKDGPLCEALKTLNFLALIMRRKRMEAGALDLEQEQIHFQLDKNGFPTDIYFETLTDANHLIEEFMLLANRTIATLLSKTGKECVFRVHDKPEEKKMAELKRFESYIGDRIPKSMMELFVVRAMAKAVYSTDNIGHYGLAFDYYTHFTSPIRRYPDMIVHRLVAKYLLGERGVAVDKDLSEACNHLSVMEQEAVQAERDSQKDFQIMWLQNYLGQEFNAFICNITKFGFFVRLQDSHCEGLVPAQTLITHGRLILDRKNFCLHDKRHDKSYTLGDEVRVRLVWADLNARQISFELVEEEK